MDYQYNIRVYVYSIPKVVYVDALFFCPVPLMLALSLWIVLSIRHLTTRIFVRLCHLQWIPLEPLEPGDTRSFRVNEARSYETARLV